MKQSVLKSCMILLCLLVWLSSRTAAQGNADEFTFVRIQYTSGGVNYQLRNYMPPNFEFWMVDYPSAERYFLKGLESWTSINVAEPVALSLFDTEFFRYPFAYMVEVGYMTLSQQEAENLREWLLRGGFLMVDDFHGPFEWQHFIEQMRKVFPDLSIVDIPMKHPIFHCFYDFEEVVQVPGLGSWLRGSTHEKGGIYHRTMGIFDDQERLMVLIIRNMDIGDAWEHTYDPRYPTQYAIEAYKLGINFVIYALTH